MIEKPTSPLLSRRGLFLGTAATAGFVGASQLGMPFISRGLAAGPIKIGLMVASPEKFGIGLKYVRYGADIALAMGGGKAAGQPIEIVQMDEPDAATTQANVKTLIEQHKVAAIVGGTFLGPSLAAREAVALGKTPWIIHSAMADELTGAGCNRYTFRVPIPFSVQYRAISPYLTGYGKKWFTVVRDGMAGQSMAKIADAEAKRAGATIVGSGTIAVGSTDYEPIVAKIKEAKPNVVLGCLLAGDLTNFLKAWHAGGMNGRIPFAQPAIGDADVWSAGAEAAGGVFTKTWHFADPKISSDDKAFIKKFEEAYKEKPGTRAWQAYIAVRSIMAALDKGGSPAADKVIQELEAFRLPAGEVTLRYRQSDHQMMHRVTILETKTEIKDKFDWWDAEAHFPEKADELDSLYGDAAAHGCKIS